MKDHSSIITMPVQHDAHEIPVVMRKLSLRSGDILVLQTPKTLSATAIERINEQFKYVLTRMGLDHKVEVLVLEEGIELHGVIQCEKTDIS